MNQFTNSLKKIQKEIKSKNFCFCKFGRAIIEWEAIEKNPIF